MTARLAFTALIILSLDSRLLRHEPHPAARISGGAIGAAGGAAIGAIAGGCIADRAP